MIWPFRLRKQRPCKETLEAKAAAIQARLDLNMAKEKYYDISKQAEKLEQLNRKNHFSESLTRAFTREDPA
jgi:hypothetical protein